MTHIVDPRSPLIKQLAGTHFFGFDGAPCSQRVGFALAEKGILRGRNAPWNSAAAKHLQSDPGTYTFRNVSLIKNHNLTPEYAAIQPNMVVPAVVHDGELHIESMEIIEQLDQWWPENPLLPADPERAQLSNELIEQGKRLHRSIRHVTFNWSLGGAGKINAKLQAQLDSLEQSNSPEQLADFYSRFSSGEIEAETFQQHLHALETGYAEQDARLKSDGRQYLTGETLTAADIIWAIKVLRLVECGYPFAANFPYLAQWYRRICARPAFKDGVLAKNRFFHYAFRAKSGIERLFGGGIRTASQLRA